MGPADDASPSGNHVPPSLSKSSDKLTWREEISDWAINVQACARAGDTRAKGTAGTLAHTLYRSLPNDKKELVKRAVRDEELDLTPDTDKSEKEQLKLVSRVVDLVAADTPAESVRRIARLNREVNSCTRANDETIPRYIARFVSRAQAYLNLVDAGVNSAESQNFAMTLLENAKIPAQTFSALIASIVSTSRTKDHLRSSKASMPVEKVDMLTPIVDKIAKEESISTSERRTLVEIVETLGKSANAAREFDESRRNKISISLNTAMAALEDAGIEEKDLQSSQSTPQVARGLWAEHNQNGYSRRRIERDWEDRKRSRFGYGKPQFRYEAPGLRQTASARTGQDLRDTVLGKRQLEDSGANRGGNESLKRNEKDITHGKGTNEKRGFW